MQKNNVNKNKKRIKDKELFWEFVKMSFGHYIGDRAHIIKKEQNVLSGDGKKHEDLINIDEDM